ncbi:2-succinyl-5-enolpyruvyl-6-hydroxy-3-cyclohexene-1-carboxylic-acid synthase [Helcobacillus massiliensis]|uniref:2-succinyl-5-enolpyruvyl-6-hydroxy-3-cyclohexene-1-carboxylate synthase n=1 Tax=Helcobacillus massiliensis TaxID=521392 RepID=A0A839QZZ9_9MICO|nr:2-succinyl-5-enolpyruvyl-6-hydroxy-3-cyclohexene-1-carboxylate synthase [Helcobacillus massiliensis]
MTDAQPVPPARPEPGTAVIPASGSGAVECARALLEALRAAGMSDLVVAPGSRSAPIVYAAHALGLRCHVRLDERSAAFTALGISRAGRADGSFAAVATTSGTATAHLLAAMMEAHHSHVPLVALTADRPAELRGTGANQTTHQVGMFEPFTALSADLPAPAADRASGMELRTWASTAARAAATALEGGAPGTDLGAPVHLNLSFRDPLTPQTAPESAAPGPGGEDASAPSRAIRLGARRDAQRAPGVPLSLPMRTVVVAGDADEATGADAAALAEHLDLPIAAEPSSSARRPGPTLITPEQLATVFAEDAHPLRPDAAVVFGHPTLSRPVLRSLLGADDVDITVVSPTIDWVDPTHRAARVLARVDPSASRLTGDADAAGSTTGGEYARAWAAVPTSDATTWQTRAALAVWNEARNGDVLILGASALIRDLERHGGPTRARIIANRGLAGIDGTMSMASGIALARAHRGERGRTRVLLGDVSAIHDLTGLVIGPTEEQPELDIVIVDDGGGRIFGGLEHAGADRGLFDRFFTTPHGTDLAAAARALGVDARTVTAEDLPEALGEQTRGRRVLVVQSSTAQRG